MAALALFLGLAAAGLPLSAQSAKPQQPEGQSSDNPFPEDALKPGQTAAPAENPGANSSTTKPTAQTAKPSSDNPFPGEDTSAPIIPVDADPNHATSGHPGPGTSSSDGAPGSSHAPDPNADPVRSPDGSTNASDDGFSSSRSGLGNLPEGDDADDKPGKGSKTKTRDQMIKEDLDVGGFYSSRKNWKAAQERFQDAFKLDSENEDAVFGLAEAERHLESYDKAREHYQLFLSYDPDGPHSKAARKALEEVLIERPKSAAAKDLGPVSPENGAVPK